RALELSPDKMIQVILDGRDFLRVGKVNVLGCDKWRLRKTRVVASQDVSPPAVKAIRVIRATQYLVLHVIDREQSVIPLCRIAVLLPVSDKPGPLFYQSLERFSREEFQISPPAAIVADRQPVLAQVLECDLVDMVPGLWSPKPHQPGFSRKLRLNRLDPA